MMAISVARLGGDQVVVEKFDNATAFSCDSNSNLILFSDSRAQRPLIAFAAGLWLSVEVV